MSLFVDGLGIPAQVGCGYQVEQLIGIPGRALEGVDLQLAEKRYVAVSRLDLSSPHSSLVCLNNK